MATKLFTFRADPDLVADFDDVCERRGWSRTEGLKRLMRKAIDSDRDREPVDG